MRQRGLLPALAASILAVSAPVQSAGLLEIALIIDGSSSISGPRGNVLGPDWGLQIGAYESIFQDSFFSNIVDRGDFDQVAVAAYVFSGQSIEISNGEETETITPIVSSYLPWTLLTNDAEAAAFGGLFADLPQPGGRTNTSEAIKVATSGGLAGCATVFGGVSTLPFLEVCNLDETDVPGILNNAFDGDSLVIDISTDGEPTEPNSEGLDVDPPSEENLLDRQLAYDEADAARGGNVTVNAIGVGEVDAEFLGTLVAGDPDGFFVTAEGFAEFASTLEQKLNVELGVTPVIPVPAALPLFLSALGGLAFVRRRRA